MTSNAITGHSVGVQVDGEIGFNCESWKLAADAFQDIFVTTETTETSSSEDLGSNSSDQVKVEFLNSASTFNGYQTEADYFNTQGKELLKFLNNEERKTKKRKGEEGTVVTRYRCENCELVFKTKGNLKQHSRTHTNERPYQCKDCGKCFRQKCHLDQHSKIHSGVKPFMCDVCHKAFSQKGQLYNHEKTDYHKDKLAKIDEENEVDQVT